jgi:hypothetical protein
VRAVPFSKVTSKFATANLGQGRALSLPPISAMAIFYFNIRSDRLAEDLRGEDLPDERAAHERALELAKKLAIASVRSGYLCLRHRVEVTDRWRLVVAVVTIGQVVDLKP